jgi:phosphonate transport system substrate-binding protein
MRMQVRLRMLASLGAVMLCAALRVHADLVLEVHPFKPPTQLAASFAPLAAYLTDKLGQPVTLRIAMDYQTHIDAIGKDAVDLAYLGPVAYVKLRETYGPKPLLARQVIGGSKYFHGKIFVRQDSHLHSLADLKGKRFAFTEPHSTMGHLVPRYQLWQAGIPVERLASYKFLGDHVNVALGVLAGDYDAGAVKEDVFYAYADRGLRAIATSPPISDHVFVASRRLAAAPLRKVRAALLQLHKQPKGAEILGSITPGITALVPAQDSEYDTLRVVLKKLKEIGVDD